MTTRLTRRGFLTGLAAAPWLVRQAAAAGEPSQPGPPAKIERTMDVHVHLFGLGDAGSGCRRSKKITGGLLFKTMSSRLLREAKTLDEGYVLALAGQLEGSRLAKGLVLAQDAVYDRRGKPDWEKTHFYVPNDYLLRVVRAHPQSMVPCVSINPDRGDAIAELDRCADQGVRALKIHPPTQGVDLADKRHAAFFCRCAERKVVVLVHTGHEHSAPVLDVGLAHPRKLTQALDAGCTVVACHCGTGWPIHDRPDMLPDFLAMLRRYPNLWGDTAVLGTALRVLDVRRILADKLAIDRLLHGSDFPFPSAPAAFAALIGVRKALALQSTENRVDQDYLLKDALGIGLAAARRAHRLICGET